MHTELLLVTLSRTLVEVAGFALLGQGVLDLLLGARRQDNPFYQLLAVVTRPVLRPLRWLLPRFIADAHVPLLAFFLLFWLWIALALVKRQLCAQPGLAC